MRDNLERVRARRLAASCLVLGIGVAGLAGAAVALAVPAGAAEALPAAQPDRVRASTPASDPSSPTASSSNPIAVPTAPTPGPTDTTSAAPTGAATSSPSSAAPSSTFVVPSGLRFTPTPTAKPRSSATASATSTARLTATPHPTATRPTYVYRTYAPVYTAPTTYTGGGTTETEEAYPYTGADGDLPSGAAATGAPLTTGTIKPAVKANPVYIAAANGPVTTKRKYIDVSGVSVDGVLADAAIAGGILGLVGGLGLWFTRGAR